MRRNLAISLLMIAVLGLAMDYGAQLYLRHARRQALMSNTALKMSTVRARIEEVLFANLLLIRGMAAFIASHPDLGPDDFKRMAESLMEGPNLLQNIAAAPNFTLTFVYPLKGNQDILGKHYKDLPGQWKQARQARDTGRMVVAGPVKLVQGGEGLIGRVPVFFDNSGGERKFWGLVSAVIDFDELRKRSGLNALSRGINLALRGRDGRGAEGEVFYGSADLFKPGAESIKQDIKTPSGSWQLAGAPRKAVTESDSAVWLVHLASLAFVLLGGSVAFIRLKSKHALIKAKSTLSEAQSVARIGSWEWDMVSDRITWSDEVYSLFGLDSKLQALSKEEFFELLHPEDRADVMEKLNQTVQHGTPYEVQHRAVLPDGKIRFLHGLGRLTTDKHGNPISMIGTVQDVTDKVESDEQLHDNREMLQSMSKASHDALIMIGADDRIVFWNPAAEKMFGYKLEEALGRRMHRLIVADKEDLSKAEAGLAQFATTGEGPVLNTVQEFTAVKRGGETFPVERSVAAFRMGGKWFAVGSIRDITERKAAQAELEKLATTDGLTGLFNRRHFNELVKAQFVTARRYSQNLSLIMYDVDFFKSVNDTHGHDVGDIVLKELSKITLGQLREVDIAGRLGGEEFGLCLPVTDLNGAVKLAERLRRKIAGEIIQFDTGELSVTISLGAAQVNPGDESPEDTLKRADNALYRAKENGRNRLEIADPIKN